MKYFFADVLQNTLPFSNLFKHSRYLQRITSPVIYMFSVYCSVLYFLQHLHNVHTQNKYSISPIHLPLHSLFFFFNVPTHSISADSSSHIFLKTPNSLGSHRSDCSYQFLFITSAIDQLTTDWWLSFHFHNERNYHHYSYVQ